MKIKGVTGGKNKGNPIEFTPNEKPEVVLKAEIPLRAEEGQQWWVSSVKVNGLQHSPRDNVTSKYANNAYSAEGEVEIHRVRIQGDKYLQPVKKQFKIAFEDCLDGMGQPDMKVTTLELT